MINFYSHEQQDEFILNLFDHKTGGTFLDVSCWHPVGASNTYTLEKDFNWTGIGFDVIDSEGLYQWSKHRTSPFVQMSVTSDQFVEYLKNNIPTDQIIDYVSLDVDGVVVVQALENIVKAGVKFKAVTFEHEFYNYGTRDRDASRQILEGLGFVRLFSDIKRLTTNLTSRDRINDSESAEDWWIHPDYFDPKLLEIKASNIYYNECVDLLKQFKNVNYASTHHCCRAFPDEYSFYLKPEDSIYLKEVFRQMKGIK